MLCGLIETTPEIYERLEAFYRLHAESPINLTAVKDREDFYIKHYLDSVYYFAIHRAPRSPLADIGSGGGFPGIVLAIFYPGLSVSLIESIGKKCKFLISAAEKLGLKNIEVLNCRAEAVKGRAFATITARGVSPVKDLLKHTLNISRPGTEWVLYKGEKTMAELAEAAALLDTGNMNVETIRIEKPFTRTYCVISR